MDKFEIQRRIFRINVLLMLVSALALIAVIPRLIQETSPDGIPKAAPIATSVAMGIRLLLLVGFLIGIRLTKLKRRINKEINLAAAIVLLLLGFVLMDGAFAYADSLVFVSTGMFISVFCDFTAAVVSIVALFLLRKKKKK
jgi:drug/metabolite transporter (DMT)-like permease